ncbi:MAG: NAD(+)/NADH kinase [Armatimonadota bacterium]
MPAMHKRRVAAAVHEIVAWLERRSIAAVLPQEQAEVLSLAKLGRPLPELGSCSDLVLSMGGDGTLLAAARVAAPLGKPLLGVNLGGFGFLASVPSGPDMIGAIERVFAARARLQPRMMIEAVVRRNSGRRAASFYALNDIVVGKGAFARLFRLRTSICGESLSDLAADGIIVATPTGSTAYSLAAGGPVVDPELRAMILTPICPQKLSQRPLVVPATRVIEIVPDPGGEHVTLTADGQQDMSLQAGDVIEVREAPFSAQFVELAGASFHSRLRDKFEWGSHR